MNNLHENDSLNHGLSDYGLCPNDWKITEESDQIYKIENKYEPQFFFRGIIKSDNGKKKWSSIQLAGL